MAAALIMSAALSAAMLVGLFVFLGSSLGMA